jgi:hypothetical protein
MPEDITPIDEGSQKRSIWIFKFRMNVKLHKKEHKPNSYKKINNTFDH